MNTNESGPQGGIASRIREARQAAGLTQQELAARVGVTRRTVWSWEAGRTRPGQEHLTGITLHCGRAVTELDGRETREQARRSPARVTMPQEARMRAVLGVVARYVAEQGFAPSMQEIMEETGFSSKSVVGYTLDACEETGLIVRGRRMARALGITATGRAFAESHLETGGLPVRRERLAPSVTGAGTGPDAVIHARRAPSLNARKPPGRR
ncbi:MAG: helix-turn-helix domain-containing protein [Acidimicrobiia bacterium]|nr:helix-turn-helix domain-containing protein [Acidimicrobiia bacterium]MYJ63322.1 helix-turn-helix domain-containing protein [Acidimicrobiia bacterium]